MKLQYLKFLLVFIIVISFNSASAQQLFETFDTIPLEKFKLNKTEFLEKYGTDDSLRALIYVCFKKRNDALAGLLISPFTAWPLAPAATVYCIVVYSTETKKNLYRNIRDYKDGKPLPEKYIRQIDKRIKRELAKNKVS